MPAPAVVTQPVSPTDAAPTPKPVVMLVRWNAGISIYDSKATVKPFGLEARVIFLPAIEERKQITCNYVPPKS
jgi:hypothetical protein